MKTNIKAILVVVFIFSLLFTSFILSGQTRTFTGAIDDNWNNAENWVGNAIPGHLENVEIQANVLINTTIYSTTNHPNYVNSNGFDISVYGASFYCTILWLQNSSTINIGGEFSGNIEAYNNAKIINHGIMNAHDNYYTQIKLWDNSRFENWNVITQGPIQSSVISLSGNSSFSNEGQVNELGLLSFDSSSIFNGQSGIIINTSANKPFHSYYLVDNYGYIRNFDIDVVSGTFNNYNSITYTLNTASRKLEISGGVFNNYRGLEVPFAIDGANGTLNNLSSIRTGRLACKTFINSATSFCEITGTSTTSTLRSGFENLNNYGIILHSGPLAIELYGSGSLINQWSGQIHIINGDDDAFDFIGSNTIFENYGLVNLCGNNVQFDTCPITFTNASGKFTNNSGAFLAADSYLFGGDCTATVASNITNNGSFQNTCAFVPSFPKSGCPQNFYGINYLYDFPYSADYETDGRIQSSQQIGIGGPWDITYDSGHLIELTNGFEVRANANFHAFIDGCGGSMLKEKEEQEVKE